MSFSGVWPELFESVLSHEERWRGATSHLAREPGYVLAANPEIPGPEANLFLRIRTDVQGAQRLLRRSAKHGLGLLLDSGTEPADLSERLSAAGFDSLGRRYLAVFDPDSFMTPPGPRPEFTPVGPGELQKFVELAQEESGCRSRTVWSLRLRNLLFSSYLVGGNAGAKAAFTVFHCGSLARLEGPFPLAAAADYALSCAVVAQAWQRALQKDCNVLYSLVPAQYVDAVKPLAFKVSERWWLKEFRPR